MNVSNFQTQENKLVNKFIYYVVDVIPIIIIEHNIMVGSI